MILNYKNSIFLLYFNTINHGTKCATYTVIETGVLFDKY